MRTAEEILKEWDFTTTDVYNPVFERMKKAINEARKEAIKTTWELYLSGNEQEIFSLIKELK